MIQPMLCAFDGPSYLIFNSNVPPLIYYSHIPVAIISLCLGIFVFIKGYKQFANILLFIIAIVFSSWVFLDSIFWASNRSDIILTVWAIILLFEPLVHASSLLLFYNILTKRCPPFSFWLIIFILFLPLVILTPTKYALENFDLSSCLATEGPIALYYTYFLEIFFTVWLMLFGVIKILKEKNRFERNKIIFLICGLLFFLIAFSWGNIVGSFTENWNLAQFGLFGMPVFLGFLIYIITNFELFNIRLIGANTLIFALWILVGSIFFVAQSVITRTIVAITEILAIIFGFLLIRSIRKEVFQREQIEKLLSELRVSNDKLWVANEKLKELDKQKTEFVSIASHQLRSPLTAIKGYSSMLLEGSFGEMGEKAREAVDRVFQSSQKLVTVIEDFLNITRIELGTMKYEYSDFDLRETVENVIRDARHSAEKNGLKLFFEHDTNLKYVIHADQGKINQVINNLIDNAIKYTRAGHIKVILEKKLNKVRLTVSDTGVGIAAETMPKLFEKFSRAGDAGKTNIAGTGLGLFVARQIVEAHKGKIWAESDGPGKGSRFVVELNNGNHSD